MIFVMCFCFDFCFCVVQAWTALLVLRLGRRGAAGGWLGAVVRMPAPGPKPTGPTHPPSIYSLCGIFSIFWVYFLTASGTRTDFMGAAGCYGQKMKVTKNNAKSNTLKTELSIYILYV